MLLACDPQPTQDITNVSRPQPAAGGVLLPPKQQQQQQQQQQEQQQQQLGQQQPGQHQGPLELQPSLPGPCSAGGLGGDTWDDESFVSSSGVGGRGRGSRLGGGFLGHPHIPSRSLGSLLDPATSRPSFMHNVGVVRGVRGAQPEEGWWAVMSGAE